MQNNHANLAEQRLTREQRLERAIEEHWEDWTLTKAKLLKGGDYEICGGSSCATLEAKHGVVPKVGDVIRVYSGWGYPIKGMDYNGEPLWFSTEAEREAAHQKWVEEYHAKLKAEYEADKDRLQAEYEQLPEPFQKRIDRALAEDPDWAWKGMGWRYEQFCLAEAVKIYDHFDRDAERINAWRSMTDYDRQREIGPKLDDGHSGNTFGCAGWMAEALAKGIDV